MLRLLALLVLTPVVALADFREFKAVSVDAELAAKITRAAEASLKDFPRLTADNLALTLSISPSPMLQSAPITMATLPSTRPRS